MAASGVTTNAIVTALVIVVTLSSVTWATFINLRHSLHLSVNEPDDPRFRLENLERIANEMMAAKRDGRQSQAARDNPYARRPRCDARAMYRTIDGTCNNLRQPWMGAAKTPLMRMAPHKYQDGFNAPRLMYHHSSQVLPSPRRISLSIHLTNSNTSTMHSHLVMNWGQFIDHDITLSPESGGEGGEEANKTQCCMASPDNFRDNLRECFPISTAHDPVFRRRCIPFLRSAPIPGLPHQPVMRYQMNDLTSFIDGSMVYGSTYLKAKILRSLRGGRLRSTKIRNEERLPDEANNPRDCFRGKRECRFASGDVRNSEQAALTSIHTLLLREHNRIAAELERLNPGWIDEVIYQETRKIIGAIIQRITYKEFLPRVLGNNYMRRYGLDLLESGRYNGYSSSVDTSVMTEFSSAAFRFGHSLIRQTFTHSGRSIDVKDIFDAYRTTDRYGTDGMLRGVLQDRIEACDRFITKGVRDNLFGEEMDLMSFNIQRGRDHGLASYYEVKKALGMRTHNQWDNMAGESHSQTSVNDMKKVYPKPEDMELFPGGMAEIPTAGALVGDTFAHIIGMQFKKLRQGDRYWHESNDPIVRFSDGQLAEIRKVTLAALFCRNVPKVQVRRDLLRMESSSNPRINCRDVAQIDLSHWRVGGTPKLHPVPPPPSHQPQRHQAPAPRHPAPQPQPRPTHHRPAPRPPAVPFRHIRPRYRPYPPTTRRPRYRSQYYDPRRAGYNPRIPNVRFPANFHG